MKGGKWFGRNNAEASSSRGPPPSDAARRAAERRQQLRAARNARRRAARARVSKEVAAMYWEIKAPLPWGDVHLPDGWHLGPQRVPVPAVPLAGREQREEILRRRSFLPPELRDDPAYDIRSPVWDQIGRAHV